VIDVAYDGYLIKVGNYTLENDKVIKAQSYVATLNSQDLDPYRDANGKLHRGVLDHTVPKVEFETPIGMTNTELSKFFKNIQNNYKTAKERKFSAKLYIPELDKYVTQDMYMSDPEPTIYGIWDGKIHYNSVRIAFIAY
jgi:hypothetical protein